MFASMDAKFSGAYARAQLKSTEKRDQGFRSFIAIFEGYSQTQLDTFSPPETRERISRILNSSIPINELQLSEQALNHLIYIHDKKYRQDNLDDAAAVSFSMVIGYIPVIGDIIATGFGLASLSAIERKNIEQNKASDEIRNSIEHIDALTGGAYVFARRQWDQNPHFKAIFSDEGIANALISPIYVSKEMVLEAIPIEIQDALTGNVNNSSEVSSDTIILEALLNASSFKLELDSVNDESRDISAFEIQPESISRTSVAFDPYKKLNAYSDRKHISELVLLINEQAFKSSDLEKAVLVFDQLNNLDYAISQMGEPGITDISTTTMAIKTTLVVYNILTSKKGSVSFEEAVMKALEQLAETLQRIETTLVRLEEGQYFQFQKLIEILDLLRRNDTTQTEVLSNLSDSVSIIHRLDSEQERAEKINQLKREVHIALDGSLHSNKGNYIRAALISSFLHGIDVAKEPAFNNHPKQDRSISSVVAKETSIYQLINFVNYNNALKNTLSNPQEWLRSTEYAVTLLIVSKVPVGEYRHYIDDLILEGKRIETACKMALSAQNVEQLRMTVVDASNSLKRLLIDLLKQADITNWSPEIDLPMSPVKFKLKLNTPLDPKKSILIKMMPHEHKKQIYAYYKDKYSEVIFGTEPAYSGELSEFLSFEPYVLSKYFKQAFNWSLDKIATQKAGFNIYARDRHYKVRYKIGTHKGQLMSNDAYKFRVFEYATKDEGGFKQFSSNSVCLTRTIGRHQNQICQKWNVFLDELEQYIEISRERALYQTNQELSKMEHNGLMFQSFNDTISRLVLLESLNGWYRRGEHISPSYVFEIFSASAIVEKLRKSVQISINPKNVTSTNKGIRNLCEQLVNEHLELLLSSLSDVQDDDISTYARPLAVYLEGLEMLSDQV
jgi:hypothetical protein